MTKERPRRVLIGEDAENWASLIEYDLQKHARAEVIIATDIPQVTKLLDAGELFSHALIDVGLGESSVPRTDLGFLRWERVSVKDISLRLLEQGTKVILITGQSANDVFALREELDVPVLFKGSDREIDDKIIRFVSK